ncbi:hypothetical protein JW758_02410 [Candidatus Peregrinibacteria bacterium]|nr:hypothetical protein [Candidatus Peregrinibacteria bacterium]
MPSENPKNIVPYGSPVVIQYEKGVLRKSNPDTLIDTDSMRKLEHFVYNVNSLLMGEKMSVIKNLPSSFSNGESTAELVVCAGQKIENLIETISVKLNNTESDIGFSESIEKTDGYEADLEFAEYRKVLVRLKDADNLVAEVQSELKVLQEMLESLADYASLVKSFEASEAKVEAESEAIKAELAKAKREARSVLQTIPASLMKKNLGGFADSVLEITSKMGKTKDVDDLMSNMRSYSQRWRKYKTSLNRIKTAGRERERIENELIEYFNEDTKRKEKPDTRTTYSGHISLSVPDLNDAVSKALSAPNIKVFKLVDSDIRNEYEKKRSSFPPPPDSKKKGKKIEIGKSRNIFQKLMASWGVRIAICAGVFGVGVGVRQLISDDDSKKNKDDGALIINDSRDIPLTEEQRNRVLAFFEGEGELTPELRIQIDNVKTLGDMEGIIFLGFGLNTIRYGVQDTNGDGRYSPNDRLTAKIHPKVKRAIRALHYGDCESSEVKFGVIKNTFDGDFITNQSEELDMTLREHCNSKTALVVTRHYKEKKENPFSHENQLPKPFCDFGERISDSEFENVISLGIFNGKATMLDFQRYLPASHVQKTKKLFFSNPELVEYKKRALLYSSVLGVEINTELITKISVSSSVQNIAQVVADGLNGVFTNEGNLGGNKGSDLKLSDGFKNAMNFLLSENPDEGVIETALEMEIPGGVVITTESYSGDMGFACRSRLHAVLKKGNTDITVQLKTPDICDRKNQKDN